jgi:hypothetical protein
VIGDDFGPSSFAPGFASFNLPGSHLRRDTAAYSFEAVLIPRFTIFRGGGAMLQVDPEFTVRRLDNLPSNPVRTPDFKPRATLYYSPRDSLPHSAAGSPDFWYVSFSGWHHSNGEEGPFGEVRTDGGRLNDVDGSFSLWGAAAAFHLHRQQLLIPRYKSLRVEWFFMKEGGLDGLYPDVAASLSLKTGRFGHPGMAGFSGWSRLFWDATWRMPNDNDRHASLKPDPFSLAMAATYAPDWRPAFLPFPIRTGDFSFFGRLYLGSDYYNINFNRPVYRVDFGVMANPYGLGGRIAGR